MIMQPSEITLVTGYWRVQNNVKHKEKHYFDNIKETLKKLWSYKIFFFYEDDDIKDFVLRNGNTRNIYTLQIPKVELMTLTEANKFIASAMKWDLNKFKEKYGTKNLNKEKGIKHYYQELKRSGTEAYKNLIAIWMAKMVIMKIVIEVNPFKTNFLGWIDCGIAKKGGKFMTFLKGDIKKGFIYYNQSPFTFKGKKLEILGGVLLGDINTFYHIIKEYKEKMKENTDVLYCFDEEVILGNVYWELPHMFRPLDPKFDAYNL